MKINQKSIAPQSEITVTCGSRITIDISISNNQATTLHNLVLSVQFYQDFQNGMQNYRLETRTCSSGANRWVQLFTCLDGTEHDDIVCWINILRFHISALWSQRLAKTRRLRMNSHRYSSRVDASKSTFNAGASRNLDSCHRQQQFFLKLIMILIMSTNLSLQ